MRPRSVVQAEYLYLASIALLVVTSAVTWDAMVAKNGAMLVGGVTAFGVGLSLLLLVLTTRKASRVALWLLIALTVIGAGGTVWQIASGALPEGVVGVSTVGQLVLTIAAIMLLFRSTARNWFTERAYLGVIDAEYDA